MAEEVGFEFLTVSDHLPPVDRRARATARSCGRRSAASRCAPTRIPIGTGVTCPILRNHPTMVAQAAATSSAILGGRFFLGVGTGEWLNEHITGGPWPAVEIRRSMLAEAVDVMRQLWTGDTVDHWGEYYTVENARLFTEPAEPIPVIWAASGADSAVAAAEHGDGLWSTSPDPDVVTAYRDAGGKGPVYGQVTLCWAPTVPRR